MPRYYFHLYNDEILHDRTGQEFADLASARRAAVTGISELIAESLAAGKLVDLSHRIDVASPSGEIDARLVFRDLFVDGGRPLEAE